MRNENTILTDMVAVIRDGLQYSEITGYDVRQGNQPNKATIKQPTVWIDRVSSKRYGIQSKIPVVVGANLVERSLYYQEMMFQITALKTRNAETDTNATMTSGDALNYLATYFNARAGIDKLAENGYASIRVSEVREPFFTSDSDLYERTPSFDLTLTHVQVDDRIIQKVDDFALETRKV